MQGNTQPNQGSGQGGSAKPGLSWTQPAAPQGGVQSQPKPATPPPAPAGMPNRPANTNIKMMAEKPKSSHYVSVFISGLVVGILLGWGITSSRGTNSTAMDDSKTGTATTSVSDTTGAPQTDTKNQAAAAAAVDLSGSAMGNSVTVPNDQDAGMSVNVSHVSVDKPTWVVVYENDNNVPGRALGATLFFPAAVGGATSGTIELLRGTTSGTGYFIGQNLDDGDKLFSLQNDKPVRDDSGNPVLSKFTTK